jgi:predicted metal-dependent hydrolase
LTFPQTDLPYLRGYPQETCTQIARMLQEQRLGDWLTRKYPQAHGMRTDGALFDYVQDLRQEYLRGAATLSKVQYDSKLHVVRNALGTHTTIARVQGSKLKTKREIRVASVFKDTPVEFLRMIVVHELAHLRERDHDKSFYQLCTHMEPEYHQLEFEVRLYLTHLDEQGARLWF